MLRRETLAAVGQGWSLVETSNNSGDGRGAAGNCFFPA